MHRQLRGIPMRFTDTKSETLNLRVSPTFKKVLKDVAEREQRSMVNMLEVLLCDYCDSKGIAPTRSKPHDPTEKRSSPARNRLRTGAAA